jgi:glutaconyl-CoA/methylmalonyl-CoA decarboxylase subunit gamma
MKLNVKIGEKTYSVEIEDLNARPIVAVVDGDRFEVTPDTSPVGSGGQPKVQKEAGAVVESAPKQMNIPAAVSNEKSLPAPLPGTVIEVFVKPGDVVESGQVVVVIEAMKMKNSIRTTREGKIESVLVSAGQTVTHKQALMEFES